jgi:hypothetical protein
VKSANDLAERKARLIAQSDVQRMQALLAWHAARKIVSPLPAGQRSARSRSIAVTLMGLAVPLLGAGKMRNALRTLSLVATGWRLFRSWRAR